MSLRAISHSPCGQPYLTFTSVEPDTPSLVAVIVTVPFFRPVARPVELTETLLASALVQVTVLPDSTLFLESYSVAVS